MKPFAKSQIQFWIFLLLLSSFFFIGGSEAEAGVLCKCRRADGSTPAYDLSGSDADFERYCQAACSARPGSTPARPSAPGAAGAVLQSLPGIINLLSSGNSSAQRASESAAAAEYKRQQAQQEEENRRLEAQAAYRAQEQTANARKTLPNPWQRNDEPPLKAEGRAPLVKQSCVSFEHKNTGGVSEELWRIENECGFPVKVIHCFYDDIKYPKCKLKDDAGWAVTDTIQAGKFHYSVSMARLEDTHYWYFICDMRTGGLCLRPDGTPAGK